MFSFLILDVLVGPTQKPKSFQEFCKDLKFVTRKPNSQAVFCLRFLP